MAPTLSPTAPLARAGHRGVGGRSARPRFALWALPLAILLVAGVGQAHAMLESSSPAPGERLDAAPSRVTVVLTEAVEPSSARLRVLDQAGARVDSNDAEVTGGDRPVLTVSLQSNLTDGAYRILWSAVSQDAHPIGGTIGFAVGAFDPPASTGASGGGASPVGVAGRLLLYVGLALAFGGVLFMAGLGLPATQLARAPRTALFAGTNLHLAGAALLAYAYVEASAAGFENALSTDMGRVLLVRLILGLGALILLWLGFWQATRHPSQPLLAAALLALAGLGSAIMGHPVVQGVGAVAIDFIHLLAALTWAGGLAVFVWFLRSDGAALDGRTLTRVGIRFGTFALLCVGSLFAAGIASALVLAGLGWFGHPVAFLKSPWGAYLAAKVLLALAMVGVAGINRYVILAPPQATGWVGRLQTACGRAIPSLRPLSAGGETTLLRRGVAVEAGFGAIVIVLAALLASVPPPVLADGADHLERTATGASFTYRLRFEPAPQAGSSSQLTLWIEDVNGTAVTSNSCGPRHCVEVHVADPGNPGQPAGYAMAVGPDGTWLHQAILWPQAGEYVVSIHASTATVFEDEATLRFDVA